MPQTSPINWIILSNMMILTILHNFSYLNETKNYKNMKKTKINLNNNSWKW